MGRKAKVSFEVKLQAVLDYHNGIAGLQRIAKSIGVDKKSLKLWIMNYESQGEDGLKETHHNKHWSDELKLSAVNEYLSGNDSIMNVCKKYKISHDSILKRWIMLYNNSHMELISTGIGRKEPMTKGRKLTFDDKVEAVRYCIANNNDYNDTIKKYKVSYQQIYSWVKKYEKLGVDGLVDRRGKAKPEDKLTEMDRLKAKIKMLEAENHKIEMENAILKKLQEIERRRR